ncbi:toxin-antitoxin system HicB family antitoxin [Nocardia carnea]|uniref:toxin-antitoxin system HicB family antitoxin n=1 Tax=Nocardia carnea TaxID=37328 RepID=UPI002453AAE5|nr:toxin-antitoxin system HicB family antitoxin [Nocardia carnea]
MPGDEQKSFTLRLPDDLHGAMTDAAKSDHISLNTALIHAARHWLGERDPEPAEGPVTVPAAEGAAPVPVAMVGIALEKVGYAVTELLEAYQLEPEDRESCATALGEAADIARRLTRSPALLWPGRAAPR